MYCSNQTDIEDTYVIHLIDFELQLYDYTSYPCMHVCYKNIISSERNEEQLLFLTEFRENAPVAMSSGFIPRGTCATFCAFSGF